MLFMNEITHVVVIAKGHAKFSKHVCIALAVAMEITADKKGFNLISHEF